MSEPVSEPVLPEPIPAKGNEKANEKAIKKPGLLRKSAFIILAVGILLFLLILPFWADRWAFNTITAALASRGLVLMPGSELSVSVFGLRLTGAQLKIREQDKPEDPPVFVADTLNAKFALLESLSSGDVIFADLTCDGVKGDLRRRKDGEPPGGVPEDGKGSTKGQDWMALFKRGMDWWRSQKDAPAQEGDPSKPGDPSPPSTSTKSPKPCYDWKGAVRYDPAPRATTAQGWHIPRILVKKISISGTSLGLPDQTPFDITKFVLTGAMVTLNLKPDEVMALMGNIETIGAGPLTLAMQRMGGQTGTLKVDAQKMPVEAMSHAAVSGDSLSRYGAKGMANLTFDATWTGWDLTGAVNSTVQHLSLNPDAQAGDRARQVAQVVNNLKDQTLVWPVKLGGTIYAPTITDNGVEAVITGSATEAVKNAAQQRASEEADKLKDKGSKKLDQAIDDKLKDQPAVKDATDKAKELFKGFGK